MTNPVPLREAPAGSPLHVLETSSDLTARRRLAAQGIRVGATVSVVRRAAGGGLVVAVAGARVAIGQSLARTLIVEPRA
ncbi:MAG TPA: FeoA family protein [Propionibacteriaceae bacterium]|nr:FeoA family protein [Propionibacteriaceae bacterium]HPZ48302.1 FeoA family protein [Propionibacteriaceae bacterium]